MKLPDILYEDAAFVVINKPAGVVVHPTYKNVAGTLLDALRAYGHDWPDDQAATIVGRLDKETSGIVVAAKTATSHAALQQILRSPETSKEYLAVVRGRVEEKSGVIADALRVDPLDRRRVIATAHDAGGVACETRFERLESNGLYTLLRCRLVTGRRHQIRVHLASRGWPIVGDRVYGVALEGVDRHALHAWRVSFAHPASGDLIQIEAPLPYDMMEILRGCFSEAVDSAIKEA